MITLERTTDLEAIRAIMTSETIYPQITDDFSPGPEEFRPPESPLIWYVLAKDGEEILGLFMFVPRNGVCFEVHNYLLPNSWGERAKEAGKGVLEWIWKNTECRRVFGTTPAYNRLAVKFAIGAGMELIGVNRASILKGGMLHDQVLTGMSRPEGI